MEEQNEYKQNYSQKQRKKIGSTVQIPCLNYPLFKWFDKWQIIKYTFKCNLLV